MASLDSSLRALGLRATVTISKEDRTVYANAPSRNALFCNNLVIT